MSSRTHSSCLTKSGRGPCDDPGYLRPVGSAGFVDGISARSSLLQQLKEQTGRVFPVIVVTEKVTEDQFRIARTTFDRVMVYALEQRQKSIDFDDELGFEELVKRCGIEFRVYHRADSS